MTRWSAVCGALALISPLGAQTFFSPLYPDNADRPYTIPDAETPFTPEWVAETPLMIQRSSPKLADINGDGDLEVIVGDMSGRLHVLDPETGAPMPGWPQILSGSIAGTAAVGDVDGDGDMEIVIGCGVNDEGSFPAGEWTFPQQGALYVFHHDGSLLRRFSTVDWWDARTGLTTPDGFTEGVVANPALGNLDDDPEMEIVFGSYDYLAYAVNADGVAAEGNAAGEVLNMNADLEPPFLGSVYRLDDDGDGRYDEDRPGDWTPIFNQIPPEQWVSGFEGVDDDGDGLIDESHPADDDEDADLDGVINMALVDEDEWNWPHILSDTVWASAAIVDVDGDGVRDVIQPGDFSENAISRARMNLLTRRGERLPGWDFVDLPSLVWTPTSVADVDGDGHFEIFMGTNLWFAPNQTSWMRGRVFGLNHDATEIRDGDGDPSTFGVFAEPIMPPPNPIQATMPAVLDAPVIGDLDGDGDLEIVAALYNGTVNGAIYAWHHDGAVVSGFPFTGVVQRTLPSGVAEANMGTNFGSPALADIDGDGDIEIVVAGAGSFLYALHHDGTLVEGTPFWAIDFNVDGSPQDDDDIKWFGQFLNTPAVGDIDLDGHVEIVFAGRDHVSPDVEGQGIGRILCIEGGRLTPGGLEWPMEGANRRNTGVYRDLFYPAGDANGDERVDVADLVALTLALAGDITLTPMSFGLEQLGVPGPLGEAHRDALVNLLLGGG